MNTNKLFALFRDYATTENYASALHEVLDYFLLAFRAYGSTEERASAVSYLATHRHAGRIVPILEEVGSLSEDFSDPLGHLHEQLISRGHKGQFFTPGHLADLMAKMTIPDDVSPGQTVYDPACGSGRMLLAAAKINRHLRFYAADIDGLCAKIAAVNFILQSLTGEVAHIDSLTNEFHGGYRIWTILRGGLYRPYYAPIRDRADSRIWNAAHNSGGKRGGDAPGNPISSGPTRDVQGSLFDA